MPVAWNAGGSRAKADTAGPADTAGAADTANMN